jgi:hypothetical protein
MIKGTKAIEEVPPATNIEHATSLSKFEKSTFLTGPDRTRLRSIVQRENSKKKEQRARYMDERKQVSDKVIYKFLDVSEKFNQKSNRSVVTGLTFKRSTSVEEYEGIESRTHSNMMLIQSKSNTLLDTKLSSRRMSVDPYKNSSTKRIFKIDHASAQLSETETSEVSRP